MLNQFLDTINKMKDLGIVRFFSQFFTEERLGPLFKWFQGSMSGQTYTDRAKQLIVYAVILALVTFLIDQIFYWTSPGQLERARRNYRHVSDGLHSLGDSIRALAGRTRGVDRGQAGNAK